MYADHSAQRHATSQDRQDYNTTDAVFSPPLSGAYDGSVRIRAEARNPELTALRRSETPNPYFGHVPYDKQGQKGPAFLDPTSYSDPGSPYDSMEQ